MLSLNFLKFYNPSLGELVFEEVIETVMKFMTDEPEAHYKVMIGSDSNGAGNLEVVSVVAIHRKGSGGRYFWSRQAKQNIHSLRQKIYAEVQASLELATLFLPAFQKLLKFQQNGSNTPFDFEIHVDVGSQGETKDLVREVMGMVKGYGYEVFVKPEAAAATTFADRHVR